MANPRAQTLQQRFGFVDDDLKTANHDEIMLWLDNSSKAISLQIFNWKDDWNPEKISESTKLANRLMDDAIRDLSKHYSDDVLENARNWRLDIPPAKPELDIEAIWEYPIQSDKYTIGFIDMRMIVIDPRLVLANYERRPDGFYRPDGTQAPEYYIPDALHGRFPKWRIDYIEREACFEVKTTIPSLGELIRQIRMYENYHRSKYYVVAPDDKFKEQLISQNIGFIKYPTGEVYKP